MHTYVRDGIRAVVVRYFNSYGPRVDVRHDASVVGAFVRSAVAGEPLVVHGDGTQCRSFTYVDDTVRGTVLAATTPDAVGRVYNLGSTHETAVVDLARLVVEATGSTSPVVFTPHRVVYGQQFDDVAHRIPNAERARRVLGWEAEVSLADGLDRTISWWRETVGA